MKFKIYRTKHKRKQFSFRLIADNGEIIIPPEGYVRIADCMAAIKLITRTNSKTPIFLP